MRRHHPGNMWNKILRHLEKFIYFAGVYTVVKMAIEVYHQLVGIEHYALLDNSISILYWVISGWFLWKFYKGIHDGEYLVED